MESLDCKLTQDLLVGYVANEVSPETREFVTRHLDRCDECRRALAQYTQPAPGWAPAPVPTADPGRRLVGRLRTRIWAVIGVVVLSLGITAGVLVWVFTAGRDAAGLPADMPVPSAAAAPRNVAEGVKLPDGMALDGITDGPGRAFALYTLPDGKTGSIEYRRHDGADQARNDYDAWFRSFRVRSMSVEYNLPSERIAKFRSGGNYYYAWQREGWFIIITVPGDTSDPTAVRDQLRDHLQALIPTLR